MIDELNVKIAVLGLGYVGLPLALAFSKFYDVIGFDLNQNRINELKNNLDNSGECSEVDLMKCEHIAYTSDEAELLSVNFYIICVPTPIDENKNPDLKPITLATRMVGKYLGKGDVVVYESTVYPGLTEEYCMPILEKVSGLVFNTDFFCGYSPERINPGDKVHSLKDIVKITSGSTRRVAYFIDSLYQKIIKAGTHLAPSIKVAEAAKVIENTQRDLNIALINELSIIFNKLEINTEDVLKAANTKWNFIKFTPGLVGGHCIGVDPYYLTSKATDVGYNPAIILAGRKLNDGMGAYVARTLLDAMKTRNSPVEGSRVLILGGTFKENCSDIRNTKVTDIIKELEYAACEVDVYDPYIDTAIAQYMHWSLINVDTKKSYYDAIIIAVAHEEFKKMGLEKVRALGKEGALIYDLKWIFQQSETDLRL